MLPFVRYICVTEQTVTFFYMGNSQLLNKKTTKDLILEAAFSFYHEPYFTDFSLNQIAEKVGISKPAIYRHFKNKEALLASMQSHFYDLLANRLLEVQKAAENGKEHSKMPFAETIQFFAKNPEYINYFLSQFSLNENFDSEMRTELLNRGVKPTTLSINNQWAFSGKNDEQIQSLYCGTTLLMFLKIREKISKCRNKGIDDNFGVKLIKFVTGGLRGISEPGDVIFPKEISDERRKELQKICSIDGSAFPPEDRIFTALASVIKKFGMTNVTIEKIADELNMAKSSLYFYFDNKNQLIGSLIEKEFSLLNEIIIENLSEAGTYSECIYIFLLSETNYFLFRPSIIPICQWLLQNASNQMESDKELEVSHIWEKRIAEDVKKIDLGFEISPEILTLWQGFIPVALTVMGKKYKMPHEEYFIAIEKIFDCIQNGIDRDSCSI